MFLFFTFWKKNNILYFTFCRSLTQLFLLSLCSLSSLSPLPSLHSPLSSISSLSPPSLSILRIFFFTFCRSLPPRKADQALHLQGLRGQQAPPEDHLPSHRNRTFEVQQFWVPVLRRKVSDQIFLSVASANRACLNNLEQVSSSLNKSDQVWAS